MVACGDSWIRDGEDVDQSLFTVYGENDSQAQDLYSEIYGPPVYDVYDDEGWIQVENKDLDDHELNNLFSEVLLQTVVFFLVDGSCLGLHNSISEEDYCANWAFGDSSPISTHRFNKENTGFKSFNFRLTLLEGGQNFIFLFGKYYQWKKRKKTR